MHLEEPKHWYFDAPEATDEAEPRWTRECGDRLIVHSDDREMWLKAREPYCGGSDVSRLLGVNYEKKPAVTKAEQAAQLAKQRGQLMAEKLGVAEPWEGDERSSLSGFYERTTIDAARKFFGWTIEPCGWLIEDPVCSRLACTLDALLWNPWAREWSPVDVKVSACTAQEDCKPKKDGSPSEAAFANGIPLYYQTQLQAQMAVTGAKHSALLVLHHADAAGLKLRAYYMPRHEAVIARIRSEAHRFWEELEQIKAQGKVA